MWKSKRLAKNALTALAEVYTRLIKINYMTGKCVFIQDNDMVAKEFYNNDSWNGIRDVLLENVAPEFYETYKNFTSLENMRLIAQNNPEGEMCTYRRQRGGEWKWIRVMLIPMKGKGNMDCILMCARDVEESAKAEEYRKEQMLENLQKTKEADAEKADFLKYLAYDLNTPMNAVIKMSGLAEEAIKSGDVSAATYYMERVSNMASYTYAVINDIARRGALQEEYVEVNEEAFSVENLLAACKEYAAAMTAGDVSFEIEAEDSLGAYYKGDALRVKQVLFCLLSNAYKFNRKGGSVKLHAFAESRKGNAEKIVFVVEDTGCGIGGDFLPELFEPFAREPQSGQIVSRGVGFGLAYAKSVTEALGADIDVETAPGEGSRFTFSLWMERVSGSEN